MKHNRVVPRWRRALATVAIVLFALVVSAYGQAITGRLVGTVQDVSKAVIPSAEVSITNQNTGISWTFVADDLTLIATTPATRGPGALLSPASCSATPTGSGVTW